MPVGDIYRAFDWWTRSRGSLAPEKFGAAALEKLRKAETLFRPVE
jgi:hypothetical protein